VSYKFYFEGGKNNSYFFETKREVIYEVIFKPTPYLFELDTIEIIENTFEFSILLKYNPNSKLPSNDNKIGATVVAIFITEKTTQYPCIYVKHPMEKNWQEKRNLTNGFKSTMMILL
jgi:hypothetical protein